MSTTVTVLVLLAGAVTAIPAVARNAPAARCSVSRAALPGLPRRDPARASTDYESFGATDHGVWGGVLRRDDRLSVFAWRQGGRASVFSTFDYSHSVYSPSDAGAVRIVGLTPRGHLVAAVQQPTTDIAAHRDESFVWIRGRAHRLAAPAGARSVTAGGVDARGRITGVVRVPNAYDIVRWNVSGSRFRVLSTSEHALYGGVTDSAGDVAWSNHNTNATVLDTAGRLHPLLSINADDPGYANSQASPEIGAGSFIVGSNGIRLVRWNVSRETAAGPIIARALDVAPTARAANSRGDFAAGANHPRVLRLATDRVAAIPAQLDTDGGRGPAVALAVRGTLAFTARRGGAVSFLRCR